MSYYDYRYSQRLELEDPPFYAIIMVAMRKADTSNLYKLQVAFPEVWRELYDRYNAPGGYLPDENMPIGD